MLPAYRDAGLCVSGVLRALSLISVCLSVHVSPHEVCGARVFPLRSDLAGKIHACLYRNECHVRRMMCTEKKNNKKKKQRRTCEAWALLHKWKLIQNEIKGALRSFGEEEREIKQNKWTNMFLLTLKNNTASYCFALFTCGGPCHLSSFPQCSGDLIFLWEQLVYSGTDKINVISLYYYLINTVNIRILSSSPFNQNISDLI